MILEKDKPEEVTTSGFSKTSYINFSSVTEKSKNVKNPLLRPSKTQCSEFLTLVINDRAILLDRKDVKSLDISKISIHSDGYAYYGRELLHRIIVKPPNDLEIDHRNRDRLDNRRSNLRICTRSQNAMNRLKQSNNRSGFKGVVFSKRYKKYIAQIKAQGIYHWLGYFNTAKEASKAYVEAATIYHGKFRGVE